jgi:hypothetical protein
MTRVLLRDLRVAFANPAAYVRSFRPGKQEGGPSKYGMFLFAIGEYHQSESLADAEKYLEDRFINNFRNIQELPEYVKKLRHYVREFRNTGNIFVRMRDNIVVPLPPRYKEFAVSGQAARIDLIPAGGYGVWIFGRNVPDWKDDPRMPLLQKAYAHKLNVDLGEIIVGIYDFEVGRHASRQYSGTEVETVSKSLRSLLRLLEPLKKR